MTKINIELDTKDILELIDVGDIVDALSFDKSKNFATFSLPSQNQSEQWMLTDMVFTISHLHL